MRRPVIVIDDSERNRNLLYYNNTINKWILRTGYGNWKECEPLFLPDNQIDISETAYNAVEFSDIDSCTQHFRDVMQALQTMSEIYASIEDVDGQLINMVINKQYPLYYDPETDTFNIFRGKEFIGVIKSIMHEQIEQLNNIKELL